MAKRHGNRVGDLESMFGRLEELVLANSGEDEFEEVFKLVVAKIWDERHGGKLFRPHADDEATSRSIRALLCDANRAWPGVLASSETALTAEHLAVCVEALARHSILDQGLEVLDGFFEFLVAKGSKGSKGQFFTPRYVIDLCVKMIRPESHETVLDPACGSGGFLIQAMQHVRANHFLGDDQALRSYCESRLWGFDIDTRAVRIAKALLILSGAGDPNIFRLNSLLKPGMMGLFDSLPESDGSTLTIEDVCRSRMRRHKGFDVILTNPPFAGEVRERHILDGFGLSKGKTRIERDVIFIERCVELLRPGGRMAIVLPHNKVAADSLGFARDWLVRKARILAVVGLGRNTFLPHTHQKASIVFLQKTDGRPVEDYNIFFAISERDGKNTKGQLQEHPAPVGTAAWDRVDHDFDDIERGFEQFRSAEGVAYGGRRQWL